MLQILINGKQTIIGNPVPHEVTNLSIIFIPNPHQRILVPLDEVPKIKAWLNKVLNNCTCSHVSCNNILMPLEDCQLFPEGELQ